MPIIAISASLLAIVAGMFLLSKTQRESLGLFFKCISIFVIIVGFLNIFAVGGYVLMKGAYMHGMHQHNERMWKEMDGDEMHSRMDGHWDGRRMGMHEDGCMEHDKGMMMNNEGHGMHDGCEMKNMQCMKKMEKDSVVVKRK